MNEIWKPAVGYESSYMVSNLGRVKTIPRRVMTHNNGYIDIPELIKTQPKNNQGYAQVGLKHNGVSSRVFVHRLVATTFIPNPNNLPCVNHKDEDITNNCVDNLEWCSYTDNLVHSYEHLNRHHKGGRSLPYLIRYKGKYTFKTISSFARFVGISPTQAKRWIDEAKPNIEKIPK